MTEHDLRREIDAGVVFWGYQEDGQLLGVMGIQPVKDVTLIRHAYVRTNRRRGGIGAALIAHLRTLADRPVFIGTWAAATWAVAFYRKHGFRLVTPEEKDRLLQTYWSIPPRQVETSVVLADHTWPPQGKESPMESIASVVEKDQFARHCGIELTQITPGHATARMPIAPHHLNGLGMVHGGAIFTLADLVFAAACNSRGYAAVAVNVSISYLKAAASGTLHAEATEISAEGRLGSYTIRITDDAGDLIAMFQGLSYRKSKP